MDGLNKRIREIRKDLNMTQATFAALLDTTQSNISSIEKGLSLPSKSLIELISSRYGINEEWIRNGTGERWKDNSWSIDDIESLKKRNYDLSERFNALSKRNSINYNKMLYTSNSFAYFLDIIQATKLKGSEEEEFLREINDFFDNLEKFIFHCTTLNLENKRKIDYSELYFLQHNKEELIEQIVKMLNSIIEIHKNRAYPNQRSTNDI